jgi:hypothetical protein
MNNYTIFIVGLVITLVSGMGVLTSQVFIGYTKTMIADTTNIVPEPIENI